MTDKGEIKLTIGITVLILAITGPLTFFSGHPEPLLGGLIVIALWWGVLGVIVWASK